MNQTVQGMYIYRLEDIANSFEGGLKVGWPWPPGAGHSYGTGPVTCLYVVTVEGLLCMYAYFYEFLDDLS